MNIDSTFEIKNSNMTTMKSKQYTIRKSYPPPLTCGVWTWAENQCEASAGVFKAYVLDADCIQNVHNHWYDCYAVCVVEFP